MQRPQGVSCLCKPGALSTLYEMVSPNVTITAILTINVVYDGIISIASHMTVVTYKAVSVVKEQQALP